MVKNKEQATIIVRPVAWFGEKVLKYQASGTYMGRTIYGDPMHTETEALISLTEEIGAWMALTSELSREFIKQYPNIK